MNYSALIQNRKSVRAFTDKKVPLYTMATLREFHDNNAHRLVPELKTELRIFSEEAREALEGAAGYNQFLIGAPQYLVLLSEAHPHAYLNAGFVMEDLILKLTDLGFDSCWITFTDSDRVKEALKIQSGLEVAAIAAFGYGQKTTKRLRVNILSMSNVDISAKRHYFEPKRAVKDMVYRNKWGEQHGLNDLIGLYDDMLWEALYAASRSPSYLNRQAYGFLLHDDRISLVLRPDEYNTPIDSDLSLGIVMLHFAVVAAQYAGSLNWKFQPEAAPELPEGYRYIASCVM